MSSGAAGDDGRDPFMLLLRGRAVQARRNLGIPVNGKSDKWPATLPEPPSAAEFCKLVDRHVPVLIEKCMRDRQGLRQWKDSRYLIDRMGPSRAVTVALTPDGAADDIVSVDVSTKAFALPHEQRMSFEELFERFQAQNMWKRDREVAYLQSQNSNLNVQEYGDLSPLLEDLLCTSTGLENQERRSDLHWATEAIGYPPEATNIWMGTSASRTSMHRDHYENLFTVIRGWKEFTVFPPAEGCFLCDDEEFPVYSYVRTEDGTLRIHQNEKHLPTRWIPIDPTQTKDSARNRPYTHQDLNDAPPQPVLSPAGTHTKYGYALSPLTIRVHEGQTLYLPSGWFHHVSQQEDYQSELIGGIERQLGVCLCLNWWYEITDEMALRLAEMNLVADDS